MALTDENSNGVGTTMLVGPTNMGGYPMYGGGGFGNGLGGDWAWILLLLLIGGNGWGMGGFGGFNGGLGYDFPWILNGQNNINGNVSSGFRDAQLHDSVTSVRDGINGLATQICGCRGDMQTSMANGFAGVQQSLCSGFAGTTAAVTNAQNAISQQINANEIANLNRSFAEQTANMQGFNGVNSGVADLRYTVATEACADRAAVGDALQSVTMQNMGNTNQIVTTIRDGIQSIKDDLRQDRLDAERRENANLRSELMYARGQASQVEQTAQILANNNAQTALFQQGLNNEVDALYNRLKSCPVNTVPVYGSQPIFTCGGNSCGCGCSGVA